MWTGPENIACTGIRSPKRLTYQVAILAQLLRPTPVCLVPLWDKTETKITERKVDGDEDSDDAVGANGGDGGGSVGGGVAVMMMMLMMILPKR